MLSALKHKLQEVRRSTLEAVSPVIGRSAEDGGGGASGYGLPSPSQHRRAAQRQQDLARFQALYSHTRQVFAEWLEDDLEQDEVWGGGAALRRLVETIGDLGLLADDAPGDAARRLDDSSAHADALRMAQILAREDAAWYRYSRILAREDAAWYSCGGDAADATQQRGHGRSNSGGFSGGSGGGGGGGDAEWDDAPLHDASLATRPCLSWFLETRATCALCELEATRVLCELACEDRPAGTLALVLEMLACTLDAVERWMLACTLDAVERWMLACTLDTVESAHIHMAISRLIRTASAYSVAAVAGGGAVSHSNAKRQRALTLSPSANLRKCHSVKALAQLLCSVWRKLKEEPVQTAFFLQRDNVHQARLDEFQALLPLLHAPGETGAFAREALLVAVGVEHKSSHMFMARDSSLCTDLVDGVLMSYEALPKTLAEMRPAAPAPPTSSISSTLTHIASSPSRLTMNSGHGGSRPSSLTKKRGSMSSMAGLVRWQADAPPSPESAARKSTQTSPVPARHVSAKSSMSFNSVAGAANLSASSRPAGPHPALQELLSQLRLCNAVATAAAPVGAALTQPGGAVAGGVTQVLCSSLRAAFLAAALRPELLSVNLLSQGGGARSASVVALLSRVVAELTAAGSAFVPAAGRVSSAAQPLAPAAALPHGQTCAEPNDVDGATALGAPLLSCVIEFLCTARGKRLSSARVSVRIGL
ncbi:hypothetical protein JKP88DRAFT_337148 [Tribonema minus]|uniref:Uncharacterized protein n=1 Tax=Tribonema minus TaxID=303371 RepID=A0A835YL91_9STRA|nr:hypothetical protein JKP88DRAFT_337148 [Tribonema minus]